MIIVTGTPRSRTSMMMYCLSLCGVPMAFEENNIRNKEQYRNLYGFFEGNWNGEEGAVKSFFVNEFDKYINPRFIFMDRNVDCIMNSWEELAKFELRPDMVDRRREFITKNKNKRLEAIKKYPHIIVDSDKFVLNPESYREKFNKVFPELDFNVLISGIDKNLFVNRYGRNDYNGIAKN